jgi:UDP-2,4-diacetamido-2,4,6-trideoxy-beta-L-altropyranose hydrolase
MRCRTLARELCQRGAEITFICRQQPGDLIELLRQEFQVLALSPLVTAFSSIPLESRALYSSWLGCSQQQDAADCLAALKQAGNSSPQWLVVDHYGLDASWEDVMRDGLGSEPSPQLLVIDDLADRPHSCELLLDQNLIGEMGQRYSSYVSNNCRLLLGPNFALLRSEFSEYRQKSLERRAHPALRRLFISMGGSDPENETTKAVIGADISGIAWERVDVVVGSGYRAHTCLALAMERLPTSKLHIQTNEMAKLMAQADLAITAAGSITWEKCSLGLPSIVAETGDNQVPIARYGHQQGFLYNLGSSIKLHQSDYSEAILKMNAIRLADMSHVGMLVCDAYGAVRVASELNK